MATSIEGASAVVVVVVDDLLQCRGNHCSHSIANNTLLRRGGCCRWSSSVCANDPTVSIMLTHSMVLLSKIHFSFLSYPQR